MSASFAQFGLHLPVPGREVWRGLVDVAPLLVTAIPLGIYNFTEAMNNVESASAAGDSYNLRHILAADGIGAIVGSILGSPFPPAVYIGHPGWKAVGGRIGYSLATGVVIALVCFLGLTALLLAVVPLVAILPILLYIGLVIGAQAFQASPAKHAPAVVLAIIPNVAAWGQLQVDSALNAAGTSAATVGMGKLAGSGLVYHGMVLLGGGAVLAGLVLGALAAFIIDHKLKEAGFWAHRGRGARVLRLHPRRASSAGPYRRKSRSATSCSPRSASRPACRKEGDRLSARGRSAARRAARAALARSGGVAAPLAGFADAPYSRGRRRSHLGRRASAGAAPARRAQPRAPRRAAWSCASDALPAHGWSPPRLPGLGHAAAARAIDAVARAARSAGRRDAAPRGFGMLLAGRMPDFPLGLGVPRVDALAEAYRRGDAAVPCSVPRSRCSVSAPGSHPRAMILREPRCSAGASSRREDAAGDAVAQRLSREVALRSHALSAALFDDLVRGESFAPLHELIYALAREDHDSALAAARTLCAIGHSSGWDMLTGLVIGLTGVRLGLRSSVLSRTADSR